MSYSVEHKTEDQTNTQSHFLILIMHILVLFLLLYTFTLQLFNNIKY